MKYYCNPINVNYRYQFIQNPVDGTLKINREAADPSMIFFKGKYYIFISMNLSVWVSADLVNWETHRLPENLPLYDYAPDARVCGEYVYFCASKVKENCSFYWTKDIINGPYEEIPGTFDFWDPNLFFDDDGRVYFYWGCSSNTPIWGVELDRETMIPKTEPIGLISGSPDKNGFERVGDDNSLFPASAEEIEMKYQEYVVQSGKPESDIPPQYIPMIKGSFSRRPFIEGPWLEKYKGQYYLQYACPGTEYNTYADGMYVGESPLGPFVLARNNPFSYFPGGFITGAGHGSNMRDQADNFWHISTLRISMNHIFERRVGLWPAGFDQDGELYCNQRYGDWPRSVSSGQDDPWQNPDWYLLSCGKPATASSHTVGKEPKFVTEENVQNWWRAQDNTPGQWLQIDLEQAMDVRAVQVNFADDKLEMPSPGEIRRSKTQLRYIEEDELVTRWILEGSLDGKQYFVIEDKSRVATDLPHDLVVRENGFQVRYIRLTILEVPYRQVPCISGLRVFGIGPGAKPAVPEYEARRSDDRLDLLVSIRGVNAVGYNILWGHEEKKLYHSCLVYNDQEHMQNSLKITRRIGALVIEQDYFVRVDAFNESGITEGMVRKLV